MDRSIVLVIDDELDEGTIEDWNYFFPTYRFVLIRQPKLAIEYDLDNVCCVFLDHRMPLMNGDAVACELRRRKFDGPIFKIGAFNEHGYPEGCIFVGKMLSFVKIAKMLAHAAGEITLADLRTVIG